MFKAEIMVVYCFWHNLFYFVSICLKSVILWGVRAAKGSQRVMDCNLHVEKSTHSIIMVCCELVE